MGCRSRRLILGLNSRQQPTFGQLLNKYTKTVQQDRPLKKRPHSPPRRGNDSPPRRDFIRRRGDHPQFPPQKVYATMPWSPPASNVVNPVWEHEGIWLQCFPMPYPPPCQRKERPRMPIYDRLGQHQSGPVPQPQPVRPVSTEAGTVRSSTDGISCREEEVRGGTRSYSREGQG